MTLICVKCNNTFSSTYNLTKHLNRLTPCNEIMQCVRCEKLFKEKYQLINHKNRKFPCKISNSVLQSQEREKDRQLQLLLSREKNAIEQEKIIIEQEKTAARVMEITARTANLQIQKEMLQIQYEGKLALVQTSEQLKLARKEKTATIINNNNITNITNNFITHVENTYFPVSDVCFTQISEHRKMIFNNMCHDPETDYVRISEECDNFAHLFVKHSTTRDMLTHVFTKSYNDPEYPDTRCVFYHKQNKQFYGMFINDGTKQLKPIDYDKDLRPEVSEMISRYVDKLNTHVPKRLQMHDLQNTQHYNTQNKLNETNACTKISDYQVSIAENVLCV